MAISSHSSSSSSFLDTLFFCEEQDHPWSHEFDHDDDEDGNDHGHVVTDSNPQDFSHMHLPPLSHPDISWEDELVNLFRKEEQQLQTHPSTFSFGHTHSSLLLAREEAVEWILKVKFHFGFTHLTAILSISYLDRFLSSLHFQEDKPWMIQLVAVTCLSLAAKVEETQVPSLLDLQVEDPKYLFEPKNIQRMELLLLSTLEWKMNPVTPISFLDHIVWKLELQTHFQWDFVKKCEDLILFLVSDSRFVGYHPSVLATATILHVFDQVDLFNSLNYQNQLLSVLNTTKEKVKECNEMIMEASNSSSINPKKRKLEQDDKMSPSSSSHRRLLQPSIKKMEFVVQQKFDLSSLNCKVFVGVASNPR